MKLHIKLVLALIAVLVVVIGIGQIVQLKKTKDHISNFAGTNIKILEETNSRL